MRPDMSLLLLFVSVYPNLTRVLLSSDELSLLIDLVEELLALNFVLLLVRFLFDFE